ncbi:actin-related protein [Acrasis kona]|uniref:Actin-related protein n=1 Tax=Acrasis kona TaxID=1008807 RepID=A0AAW2ZSN2_9EUKA
MTTQQPTQPDDTCYVLQIGSYDIKYGSSDFDAPKSCPNCVAFPTDSSKATVKKFPKKQGVREKQLIRIRGQLLADRGIISKDDIEKDTYFEKISIKERSAIEEHPSSHILHSPTKHRNLPIHNLLGSNTSFQYVLPVVSDLLVGQDALDKCKEENVEGVIPNYELFHVFWKGRLNVDRNNSITVAKALDCVEALFSHIFKSRMSLTQDKINTSSLILITPDQMIDQAEHIDLLSVLDVLFHRIGFQNIIIQRESVAATFGAGVSNVCVVDMGESKTSISMVDDGELVSSIDYVCGGYHIIQTLLFILNQSQLPLPGVNTDAHINDRQALRSIMETHCNADVKGSEKESYRLVEFLDRRNRTKYKMEVGDPLYISTLAYFNPKLLGKNRQEGPLDVHFSSKAEEESSDVHHEETVTDAEHFLSTKNFKSLSQQVISSQDDALLEAISSTKKKRNGKKTEIAEAAEASSLKDKKAKVIPGLDRLVVKVLKKSGIEFSKTSSKGRKQQVNILLVGGCSQIKEFPNLLKTKIEEHLTNKLKITNIQLNISSNDRDKGTDVRFMSWTGGCVLSQLESAKEMYITRQEYSAQGIKVVLERSPI